MKNRKFNRFRASRVAFWVSFGIGTLFLAIIAFLFLNLPGLMLVALAAIIFLGQLRRLHPELFPKPKDPAAPTPPPTPTPPPFNRTYMTLIGLSASGQHCIVVNKSPFIVGSGRSSQVDYTINDPYLSSSHLKLEYDETLKQRYATDTSRYGTSLNGRLLEKGRKTPLKHGDTLKIGSMVFSVEAVHY